MPTRVLSDILVKLGSAQRTALVSHDDVECEGQAARIYPLIQPLTNPGSSEPRESPTTRISLICIENFTGTECSQWSH